MIQPGSRVLVYDARDFKNDRDTPVSMLMRPATVLRRYGYTSPLGLGRYPDVVDVRFDHDGRESRRHFTHLVRQQKESSNG